MNRLTFILLILILTLCMSACNMHTSADVETGTTPIEIPSADMNPGDNFHPTVAPVETEPLVDKWDPDMFRAMRNMNLLKIKPFVELLANVIAQEDAQSLKLLFAPNILEDYSVDDGIEDLFTFFEGTILSVTCSAGNESEKKENGVHYAEIRLPFNVQTTIRTYCIAVKICIVDSTDVNNVGICSLYIIDAENTDMDFTYWGDYEWRPGIVIDTTIYNTPSASDETTSDDNQ